MLSLLQLDLRFENALVFSASLFLNDLRALSTALIYLLFRLTKVGDRSEGCRTRGHVRRMRDYS